MPADRLRADLEMFGRVPQGESLALDQLTKRFAELRAVDDVTVTFAGGVRTALIGPNGAGKSTLFNLISGILAPTSGAVRLGERDISRLGLTRRSQLGIVQTFQRSSLFDGLTARENVALSLRRIVASARRPWSLRCDQRVSSLAAERLAAVGLDSRTESVAATLSHGERRQLELAVALATDPKVLLLDEPTAGMSAAETANFVSLVKGLDPHLTVVVVEHDLDVVFELADRIVVLAAGRLLFEGSPAQARASRGVQEAYLGGAETDATALGHL